MLDGNFTEQEHLDMLTTSVCWEMLVQHGYVESDLRVDLDTVKPEIERLMEGGLRPTVELIPLYCSIWMRDEETGEDRRALTEGEHVDAHGVRFTTEQMAVLIGDMLDQWAGEGSPPDDPRGFLSGLVDVKVMSLMATLN